MSVRIVHLGQLHRMSFWNMGVTTMKMISNTSMMSAIGITFGADICAPALGLYEP